MRGIKGVLEISHQKDSEQGITPELGRANRIEENNMNMKKVRDGIFVGKGLSAWTFPLHRRLPGLQSSKQALYLLFSFSTYQNQEIAPQLP